MALNQWHAKAVGFRSDLPAGQVPSHEEVVVLLQANNHFGDAIFCYVKLPYERYAELKSRIANMDVVDPRQFGSIVAAGLGAPTAELQEEVNRELGIVSVNLVEPEPLPDKFDFESLDDGDYPF